MKVKTAICIIAYIVITAVLFPGVVTKLSAGILTGVATVCRYISLGCTRDLLPVVVAEEKRYSREKMEKSCNKEMAYYI